jgi:ethanolamine utilization protein EutP (predicted NTPase)
MKHLIMYVLLASVFMSSSVFAKNVKYRKTQEVNFDGSAIDGERRSPDGSYLHQKRGVKFMPLYRVNLQLEKNIADYLR